MDEVVLTEAGSGFWSPVQVRVWGGGVRKDGGDESGIRQGSRGGSVASFLCREQVGSSAEPGPLRSVPDFQTAGTPTQTPPGDCVRSIIDFPNSSR